MKIDQNIQYPAAALTGAQKGGGQQPQAKEAANPDKTGGTAFSISISKTAGQLSKAAELSANASTSDFEIRQDRIDSIRDQLASGSYNISGRDVATKMLNALKG